MQVYSCLCGVMKCLRLLVFSHCSFFLSLFLCSSLGHVFAADDIRSVRYSSVFQGIDPDQLSIDLYPCRESSTAFVVYVHGGAWQRGDKSSVHGMPRFFDNNNICFASVNYPLDNAGRWSVIDVQVEALALFDAWLAKRTKNSSVKAYRNVSLIGHSAGAHLLALAEKRYGWNSSVNNIILLDSASYDIRSRYFSSSRRYRELMFRLLRLDAVPPSEYLPLFNRYSPSRYRSKPRSTGTLNILAISSSNRFGSLESAKSLELSFNPAHGYKFRHLLQSWQHRDFPRMIGSDAKYDQAILDIVQRRTLEVR